MSDQIRNIKGTKDLLPSESRLWLETESIIHNFMTLHGYSLVRTPIFEKTELFSRSIGQETDIVNKEMYTWEDIDGTSLTLRPELTAPVMRMISEEMRSSPKPLRLSYYGQCFRYEESKKGRYREFFQYGVELIGASGPLAEAEVVSLAINMLEASGLADYEVRIGHVGVLL